MLEAHSAIAAEQAKTFTAPFSSNTFPHSRIAAFEFYTGTLTWQASSNGVYSNMKIIETSIFTKKLKLLLPDEEYRKFQNVLILNPKSGKLIKGSGGLRKIRWSISGKGKSGGVRVIYYYVMKEEIILMLLIYPKSERDDLTKEQQKILKSLVKEEFKWKTNYL